MSCPIDIARRLLSRSWIAGSRKVITKTWFDSNSPPPSSQNFAPARFNLRFDNLVARLGPPPPKRELGTSPAKITDPRAERASRGFFADMQGYFGERDSQDPNVAHQRRCSGGNFDHTQLYEQRELVGQLAPWPQLGPSGET